MIHDGYSRRAKPTNDTMSLRVIYRPALEDERRRFRYDLRFMQGEAKSRMLREFIKQHIVEMGPLSVEEVEQQHEDLYEQLFMLIQGLVVDASGERWVDVAGAMQENLVNGIKLEIANPRLAKRDCSDCKKWWYNETTGLVILNNRGEPQERFGPTLCETPNGCAKGTPEKPRSLNTSNGWAWSHFKDCDAIGQFPNDPIVARNARVIRHVLKTIERKASK